MYGEGKFDRKLSWSYFSFSSSSRRGDVIWGDILDFINYVVCYCWSGFGCVGSSRIGGNVRVGCFGL